MDSEREEEKQFLETGKPRLISRWPILEGWFTRCNQCREGSQLEILTHSPTASSFVYC